MENCTLLDRAILFAAQRHAGQRRKGTPLPYITHCLETMTFLSYMKADQNLLAAGVLHDILEDTPTTKEELSERFGEDVCALVLGHSEDKSRSWEERKQAAVDSLSSASFRLKKLILADKTANLRSMCNDHIQIGEKLWERFNAPKERQAWYYGQIRDSLRDMAEHPETADVYRYMSRLYEELF